MKLIIKLSLVMLLATLSKLTLAQDMIYLIDGTTIQATNVDIQPEKIKYQRFNAPNGPFYVVKIENVASIVFAKGGRKDFAEIEQSVAEKQPDPFFDNTANQQAIVAFADNPHSVGFNFAMLVARQIEVDYEYRFKNTILGLSIPVVYNMDPNFLRSIEGFGLNFSAGADLNIYVWREDLDFTTVDFFTGLGVDGGQSREFIRDSIIGTSGFFSVYVIGGFRIYAGKNVSFEISGRLGGRNYLDSQYSDIEAIFRPNVRFRYHF